MIKQIKLKHYGNTQLPNGQAYCDQSPIRGTDKDRTRTIAGIMTPKKPNFNDFLQKSIDIKAHLDKSQDRSRSFLKRSKVNAKADKLLVQEKKQGPGAVGDLDKSGASGTTPKEERKKKRLNFFRAMFGKAKDGTSSGDSSENGSGDVGKKVTVKKSPARKFFRGIDKLLNKL